MITGLWKVNAGLGDNVPLVLTEYYYSWFIIETVKSIVASNGNYANLANLEDPFNLECSSVSHLDVLIESMMEMYYGCHPVAPELSVLMTEDEESIPSEVLNGHLGDLHHELYHSLLANNSFQEFLHIVNEIGGVSSIDYNVSVNVYGNTLHYVVRKDANADLLNSLW